MDILKTLFLLSVLSFSQVCYSGEIVNINNADQQTLMSIKGIGEKRATAIIEHRDQYGPFKSVDELVEVKGISESLLDKTRKLLTVKADN